MTRADTAGTSRDHQLSLHHSCRPVPELSNWPPATTVAGGGDCDTALAAPGR